MSLIVDPDYLIHSLRLAYLRRIDDNHGPRVITFPSVRNGLDGKASSEYSVYRADTHVVMAGLTDEERHPELATVYSPSSTSTRWGAMKSSGLDSPSKYAEPEASGSKLKYTNTIYGAGRSGALGMRVNGRRASARIQTGKGSLPELEESQSSAPIEERLSAPTDEESPSQVLPSSSEEPALAGTSTSLPHIAIAAPLLPKKVLFAPETTESSIESGAALSSNDSVSSSHQIDGLEEPSLNAATAGSDMNEAAPIIPAAPSMTVSALDSDEDSSPDAPNLHRRARSVTKTVVKKRSRSLLSPDLFRASRTSRSEVEKQHANRSQVSALSARLAKQDSGPENPFAAFYAGIAGRAGTAPSMTVDIYFPWANATQATQAASPPTSGALSLNTKARSMKLDIRKDATMEEVIGYGLYCYTEERWQPELIDDDDHIKTSTIGWTLMIVEDGEVDDDFPAIDQSLLLGKFGGDEFAICQASASQIRQHRDVHSSLARRASRVTTTPKPAATRVGERGESVISSTPAMGSSVIPARLGASLSGTPALSKSALGTSTHSIFLRVLVTPNPEVRYKTTLQVPSDMYLADVLEMICRKRHLSNVDEWALIVPDKSIVVPLDRTVESLQGNHDLALVRRSSLGALGGTGVLSGSSTNPNASIFQRYSATGQPKYTKALDIAAAYKSFTVYRKSAMFGGRQNERTLTLDGDWLHIMPTDMKTIGKAASFHISSVVACKLSSKLPNAFKLVVWRESPRDTKRYDFDTDSPRLANEIVREINQLRSD